MSQMPERILAWRSGNGLLCFDCGTVYRAPDDAAVYVRERADAAPSQVREALEWALDNAGTDHPHYPYRNEGGRWAFPYLVSGTPLGGGVGEASFDTALEAVQAALALDSKGMRSGQA